MKLKDLKQYDPSLEIISGNEDVDLSSICDSTHFKENGLYFCKDQSFLDKTDIQSKNPYGLIIQKGKITDINNDHYLFVAQVDSVPLAMTLLSKPFFEELIDTFNDEVDGRQMGTAQIHPSAIIAQNVFIGKNVTIEEGCRIHTGAVIMSHCSLGKGCEIFPNTVLHPQSSLGKNVRVSSNTTIGSDGFGYHFDRGVHHKIWHMGGVVIEDDVEIGSLCSIDQGTFSATVIGAGSKLDNQVHVAHNVKVGKGVILCGQVGLSGSCRIGDYCVFGGKSGVAPDCVVGDQCQVGGNTMVTTSWPSGVTLGGHPARPLNEWMRGIAYLRKQSLKRGKS